ncbi:MAG: NFACT RNA binding domain-containing protein [Bacteroidota bacterium]
MHFHHYTLIHLSRFIQSQYQGTELLDCFSQNKNELVLEWERGYLRVGCHTPMTYIAPSDEFAKARKNVVDLFPEIKGTVLQKVHVVPFEREMILAFEGDVQLILKMHGIGANVMLRHADKIQSLFIHRHEQDWEYEEIAGTPNLQIPGSVPADLTSVQSALRSISMVYDKQFAVRVLDLIQSGKVFSQAYEQVLTEANSQTYYIYREPSKMRFLLFPPPEEAAYIRVEGIGKALGIFMRCHYQYEGYRIQFRDNGRALQKPFKKFKKVYQSYQKNIKTLQTDRNPEELGHILMANLHAIPPKSKQIELQDLYGEGTVKISLDPRLSPQDNAAKLYKKSKQRKGKLEYLLDQVDEIEDKLLQAEEDLEDFEQLPQPEMLDFGQEGFQMEELKAMKEFSKRLRKERKTAQKDRYPFRTFQKEGYEIFVGKNARNSDELSFKFASKLDLWLHAKDVPGSHVIIRQRAGREIPPTVLEYAASLAAFYSKRKTDSLVAVQYTPRKYIRKRKGDPAGLVAVDREKVIMVEPGKG